MDWSPKQARALDAVGDWLRRREPQVFRLYGYAGTGKTTLAQHLAEGVDGEVLFAAYTGKAAHVLRRAGCPGASTIHSLIYRPRDGDPTRLLALLREQTEARENPDADPADVERLEREIAAEREELKKPRFVLNRDSVVRDAALLVIDECSMVDERMGTDLLSFGVPILVLGDPAQLPPVGGAGFFTAHRPDVMLTEIHRQAEGNPIVGLAARIRGGEPLRPGDYGGGVRVVRKADFDKGAIGPDVQILVGRNKTRRRGNAFRRGSLGFLGDLPVAGDRLVCLRNDHDVGLLNGAIWHVVEVVDTYDDSIELVIDGDSDEGRRVVEAHSAPFRGDDVLPWAWRDAQSFDFGYCLTVHKSQGSQWPEVCLIDESRCFRGDARRWLYTGITRAEERLTVVV